jgi:hypothetical protein
MGGGWAVKNSLRVVVKIGCQWIAESEEKGPPRPRALCLPCQCAVQLQRPWQVRSDELNLIAPRKSTTRLLVPLPYCQYLGIIIISSCKYVQYMSPQLQQSTITVC